MSKRFRKSSLAFERHKRRIQFIRKIIKHISLDIFIWRAPGVGAPHRSCTAMQRRRRRHEGGARRRRSERPIGDR